MSEMNVENMNTVEMTVEDNTNIPMEDPTTERIIHAVSPTVDMERIDGGLKITITDVDGEHANEVYDGLEGEPGPEGQQGPAGQDGQDAYVYIRYSHTQPTQDSDMSNTPDDWIGIYSGDSATAPTAYTDYAWYKIKGEQGSSGVNYASELNMSPLDSTKADIAINAKVAIQQNVADAGKALGIGNDGRVTPVPFSGDDFTGATDSTAGVHGYVPAPAAGDQGKILMGDGTWSDDIPDRLDAVENVYVDTDVTIATSDWTASGGTYTYTWTNSIVTAGCGVEVALRDGADSAGINGFDYDKVTGGIQFTTEEQPTGSLPVTIRIINTKADGLLTLNADEVLSEAITGCDTVEEALTNLDGRVGTVPSGTDLQSEITALNSKLPKKTTQSVTTSASGTFTITKPAGASYILDVYTSIGATYYCVRYSETSYGVFYYEAPHNPPASGTSLTAEIIYV